MEPFAGMGFLFVMALAIMGGLHAVGVDVTPSREKRTYIFETEDGERYNPFSETFHDPYADADYRPCFNCGEPNDPEYDHCSSCSRRLL